MLSPAVTSISAAMSGPIGSYAECIRLSKEPSEPRALLR